MPSINDIHDLVADLHQKKILNADTTLGQITSALAGHIRNKGEEVGWYFAGGDHYVVICGRNAPDVAVVNPAAAAKTGGGW